MRILLTGASSFTGFWFARQLVRAGHEVVATLLHPRDYYSVGTRAERVKILEKHVRLIPKCAFGSDEFMAVLNERHWDVLAHHAAQVTDYRSPNFDILAAVAANTKNVRAILSSGQLDSVLITSSIFAQNEGIGSLPLAAFSPYGLSKGITNDIIQFYAEKLKVRFGRFVIPNPFGPWEEPRFCEYLIRTWKSGSVASVSAPIYVRDNIHVDLLASSYVRYVEMLAANRATTAFSPSGYVGSQREFAERMSREMRPRLNLRCELAFPAQSDFSEPLVRVNLNPAQSIVLDWNEEKAWDGIAEYYSS